MIVVVITNDHFRQPDKVRREQKHAVEPLLLQADYGTVKQLHGKERSPRQKRRFPLADHRLGCIQYVAEMIAVSEPRRS